MSDRLPRRRIPPTTEDSSPGAAHPPTLDERAPAARDRCGEEVGGWLLERVLGRGATSVVYLARRPGRPDVALKLIDASLSPRRRERFLREWRTLARLDHPGLLRVLEGGDSSAGPWLALELIEGESLASAIFPLPVPRALEIAEAIARAMDHAHRRGVVHRDLKPGNVLIGRDGAVKVVDFGLVRDLETPMALTADGARVGTPPFMSPEQVGVVGDAVGVAADVHAIGAMLYLLCTGTLPFQGIDHEELFAAIRTHTPPPLAQRRPDLSFPDGLEQVLARAFAKRPGDRYLTALELAGDLAAVRRGQPPPHAGQTPDPTDPALSLAAGELLGTYRLLYVVGRGGSAVVWKGLAPDGAPVALKVLRDPTGARRARFARERRLLEELSREPGFIPLLDHGVGPAGPWLAMPFLPGGTLRDRLERGPLGIDEALALGRALASALARAHARGVTHRDIKPENVIFEDDGAPCLADLGVARHDRGEGKAQSTTVTLAGGILGTAGYASPEQLEDPHAAGPPGDVFSLGVVLYECLSGTPAFAAESLVACVERLVDGVYVPLREARPDTPAWLEAVVARAMDRDPARRFPDGAALEQALQAEGGRPGLLARVRGRMGGRPASGQGG